VRAKKKGEDCAQVVLEMLGLLKTIEEIRG